MFFNIFFEISTNSKIKETVTRNRNKTNKRNGRKKEKHNFKTVHLSGKGSPEQKSDNLNESHPQCQMTQESNAFTVILGKETQGSVHFAGVRCIETKNLTISVCVVPFLSTNAFKPHIIKRSRLKANKSSADCIFLIKGRKKKRIFDL